MDPVAVDWDGAGRLWVVEMADYPLGLDGRGQVGGRVRVLEDGDGDGRYDRGRVYAEGLSFPTGVLAWRDGVLVTAAPEILFLRDADGDGPAQFGRERDDWGRWFGTQNIRPLWHYVIEDRYLRRNPHVAAPDSTRLAVGPLLGVAEGSGNPLARLHALWLLAHFEALRVALLVKALGDPHPGVRENALRIAEGRRRRVGWRGTFGIGRRRWDCWVVCLGRRIRGWCSRRR